jgi:hypothetical protein
VEAALNRCRVLAGQIESKLRHKRPPARCRPVSHVTFIMRPTTQKNCLVAAYAMRSIHFDSPIRYSFLRVQDRMLRVVRSPLSGRHEQAKRRCVVWCHLQPNASRFLDARRLSEFDWIRVGSRLFWELTRRNRWAKMNMEAPLSWPPSAHGKYDAHRDRSNE